MFSAYDLTNSDTIARHLDALDELASIAIVVPEQVNPEENNRILSIDFIERLGEQGVSVTRIDSPGGHMSLLVERFIQLAEEVLTSMTLNETSIFPLGKAETTWGNIKQQ